KTTKQFPATPVEVEDAIRRRVYESYEQRGRADGFELEIGPKLKLKYWVPGKCQKHSRNSGHLTGWACSACDWTFPLPSLLSDPEAKKAYDRLASAKFQRHDCATHQPVASLDPDSFIARAKGLVKRGFKPKDAAEIAASEIM